MTTSEQLASMEARIVAMEQAAMEQAAQIDMILTGTVANIEQRIAEALNSMQQQVNRMEPPALMAGSVEGVNIAVDSVGLDHLNEELRALVLAPNNI